MTFLRFRADAMGILEKLNHRRLQLPGVSSSRLEKLKAKLNVSAGSARSTLGMDDVYRLVYSIPESHWNGIPRQYDDIICQILWRSFDGAPPLSSNRAFLLWFIKTRVKNSLSMTRTLIKGLAWDWPQGSESVIEELEPLTNHAVVWPTKTWREHALEQASKGESLAQLVADLWLGKPSESVLLVKKLWVELVVNTSEKLASGEEQQINAIDVIIKTGFDTRPKLRWADQELFFLNHLLPPLNGRITSRESTCLKQYVLPSFGRPDRGVWTKASSKAQAVGFQWLVTLRFERFFSFVEKYQVSIGDEVAQRHWHARKQFWQGVLDSGAVDNVQLALASNLRSRLGEQDRQLLRPAYLSTRGTSFTADHAALVMKIKNMTIVEWSHNRASSVWFNENNSAPPCNKSQYDADQMIKNSDKRVQHRGDWQSKYASLITNKTGVWINRSVW